jgi:hypothetical protein
MVGLAACGVFPNPNYPPELPLDPALTQCTIAGDCTVVELGCCDACNGGVAVAVRSDARGDVIDEYSEACGPTVACTLMGCPPLEAVCDAGTCTLEQGTTF